jgi:hypothetical protein
MNIPRMKIVPTKIPETTGSVSLGLFTRDANGDRKVTYFQVPNRSTKDEPSLLRVPPVALPPLD